MKTPPRAGHYQRAIENIGLSLVVTVAAFFLGISIGAICLICEPNLLK